MYLAPSTSRDPVALGRVVEQLGVALDEHVVERRPLVLDDERDGRAGGEVARLDGLVPRREGVVVAVGREPDGHGVRPSVRPGGREHRSPVALSKKGARLRLGHAIQRSGHPSHGPAYGTELGCQLASFASNLV